MRFVDIKYKKYRFPFNSQIQNSTQIINHKDVIILKAQDELGNYHFGEVSPLTGFSIENIEDCQRILNELINRNQLNSQFDELKIKVKEIVEYPSLMFGLEQLILSGEKKINSNQLGISKTKKVLNINGLLGIESQESILRKAYQLVDRGHKTIKLKIGRPDFQNDLEIISLIKNEFSDAIKLRLDNNGSWSFEEAIKNIRQLSHFDIEYIEQPVKEKHELYLLAENCRVGLAADECIANFNDAVNIIQSGNIEFLVLKPSIRLGIYNTIKLIEQANKVGVKIIVSSAFETVVARSTLLFLASLTNHNLAHGLATELLGTSEIYCKTNYDAPQLELSKLDSVPTIKVNF